MYAVPGEKENKRAFSPTGTVTRKKEHTVWPRGGQSTTTILSNSQ